MHTESNGAGEPVVALHSSGMSGRQWRKLMAALSPSHRVVLPDFLGSGENPLWPAGQPFHFQRDVDAIAELISTLGPVHLIGHSYGGFIASVVARLHTSRLRSLTLFDPVAFGVLHDANDAAGLADLARAEQAPGFFDERSGGDDDWMRYFVDYWQGEGAWRGLPDAFRDMMLRVGKKVFYEVTTLLQDRTPRSAYAAVIAPTLLFTGEHSPAAAQNVVRLLAESLPNARTERIAGAGHMGPISHADVVNAAIKAHLLSVRS